MRKSNCGEGGGSFSTPEYELSAYTLKVGIVLFLQFDRLRISE